MRCRVTRFRTVTRCGDSGLRGQCCVIILAPHIHVRTSMCTWKLGLECRARSGLLVPFINIVNVVNNVAKDLRSFLCNRPLTKQVRNWANCHHACLTRNFYYLNGPYLPSTRFHASMKYWKLYPSIYGAPRIDRINTLILIKSIFPPDTYYPWNYNSM